jgi:hypothetical protein
MMRRGPLADNPIETLLDAAARERIGGVIELHGPVEGQVYLVEGDVYLADLVERPPLERRLLEAGLLTEEQIARHTEPGDESPYLALALDTDATIDEHAISDWLFDLSAATLAQFIGVGDGEYELDPYGSHPAGILASWTAAEVFERARVLQLEHERRAEAERAEAERLEAERKAEIERREAEQRADAERARATQRDVESADDARPSTTETAAATGGGDAVADDAAPTADPTAADDTADLPPPPAAAAAAHPSDESQVLIVTSDAVPDGVARIELTPIEWRVVVLAARGMSLGDLARRLDVDRDEVGAVVASLSGRGLLATVG